MAKAIAKQVDLMVGSRFHSLVFALASGVPAVALGWAHKYPELMRLVGLEGNALIHTEFDEKQVVSMLDTAWERRSEHKAAIAERLPGIRKKRFQNLDQRKMMHYLRKLKNISKIKISELLIVKQLCKKKN